MTPMLIVDILCLPYHYKILSLPHLYVDIGKLKLRLQILQIIHFFLTNFKKL